MRFLVLRNAFVQEDAKLLLLIAILGRMLLPYERIRSYGEEIIEVPSFEGPELEELAFQRRLEIEGHTCRRPAI